MTRVLPFVLCLLVGTLIAVPAAADGPPKKLTPSERFLLTAKRDKLNETGAEAYLAGKHAEAGKAWEAALEAARQLYPKADYPDGHTDLATSLNNLGLLYRDQSRLEAAEPLLKEALGMSRRLHKGDHREVATAQGNLGLLYQAQGKFAAAAPLLEDALEMLKRVHGSDNPEVATVQSNLGLVYRSQGRLADAERLLADSLGMLNRLVKGDHPLLARGLNNLALVYRDQGKLGAAEARFSEAAAMFRRVLEGDHPYTAMTLNNLGWLYRDQGRYADAEVLLKTALEMQRRVFGGDHPDVAQTLNNLGLLSRDQGKLAAAESLLKEALDTYKRARKGDHPDVTGALNNLASLYQMRGELAAAEPLLKEALEMQKRLFKGDHPITALNLNNLGCLHQARGDLAAAEALHLDALEMQKRLFKGDHPEVAQSLNNLAFLHYRTGSRVPESERMYKGALDIHRSLFGSDHPYTAMSLSNLAHLYFADGRDRDAERCARDALVVNRRGTFTFAQRKSEGEALTLVASQPLYRDHLMSISLRLNRDAAESYVEVWASKGIVPRVYEYRQLHARAAATNPRVAALLAGLTDVRRRRAELLLAPATTDPVTRKRREDDLKDLDAKVAKLDDQIRPLLTAVARTAELAEATPADLQKVLPADAAVVDFLRYVHFEYDPKKPGKAGETRTPRYLVFVVTKDRVAWLDLGPAARVDAAVGQWREAITTPPHTVPADIPAKVRELVWEPVRKHLPAGTKVVYVCPDAELTKLPWAALPGDRPGTILLEDIAVAAVPHGPFLLDMLWPPEERQNPPAGLLAVGGVAFSGEPRTPGLWATLGSAARTRGELPVDPKKALRWDDLPGAKAEAEQVAKWAADRKYDARLLTGPAASADRVLAELPKARYAHLATHGFFADKQFRSVLQVDPKDYERAPWGERVGAGALNPMVLSGLVFAGANLPGTPGRGVLTGEHLIDRDLSGLELAVLSACETGLGDVAGGEGVYGLQRAFHVAGTRNVVASLWKVPDAATAALMGEFYRHLWDEKNPLPPVEALRQAQLAVYRADPRQFADMARRGPGLGEKNFDDAKVVIDKAPVNKDGRNPPVVWAAWTLSGPGR